MVGWIILAVLAILILLVFFLPYGVDVGYADEVLRVGIKAGPLRIWLLPKKPLTEKQRLKAEAKKAKKEARRAARAAKKAAAAKEKEINDSVTVKPKPKLDFDTIVALAPDGLACDPSLFPQLHRELLPAALYRRLPGPL